MIAALRGMRGADPDGDGSLFHPRFYALGTAMIVAAVLGAVAGLAGGGPASILLISGLLSAASMFVVGTLAVRSPATR